MIIKNASFITSAARPEQFIKKTKPTIAVVGKSNVGKSSFINTLANMKKLAKTSDTPGRTRLVNYFDFGDFVVADLPGYGYAKVSKEEKDKWAVTMEKFFADKSNYDYVFALADVRHDPTPDDLVMISFLHSSAVPFTVIVTKTDKVSKMQLKNRIRSVANKFAMTENDVLGISSQTKAGREEVLAKIEKVIDIIKSGKI